MDQACIDWGAGEIKVKVVQILGLWQFGNGELVADRPGLFLGDLGLQQITDNAWRLMLGLDARGHDVVLSTAHPVEFEAAHQIKDLGAFQLGWSS